MKCIKRSEEKRTVRVYQKFIGNLPSQVYQNVEENLKCLVYQEEKRKPN